MDLPHSQQPSAGSSNWLGAFAHPAFAVVWVASTTALIGIAMYDTASGWLMTTLDVNPLDVSLVHAATNLPMFLFTLPAGAIADIVNPRRLIVAVSCAIVALISIFAALVSFDLASPVMLLLTTFLLSAAWALNSPAWLSILPYLVPKADLPGAIAAHGVGYNLSRTVGPALGGFIIVHYGMATPLWAFVVANLGVIASLIWWRGPCKQTGRCRPSVLMAPCAPGSGMPSTTGFFERRLCGLWRSIHSPPPTGDSCPSSPGAPARGPNITECC